MKRRRRKGGCLLPLCLKNLWERKQCVFLMKKNVTPAREKVTFKRVGETSLFISLGSRIIFHKKEIDSGLGGKGGG